MIKQTPAILEPRPLTILSCFENYPVPHVRRAVIAVLRPFQRAGEIGDEVGAVFDTD